MRDEGVTKYECRFSKSEPPHHPQLAELISCRNRLFALGLIGVYPDGIGFGNVSFRPGGMQNFFITGTQTGHKPVLSDADISLVTGYDIGQNRVTCEGSIPASSESMTHAAVYEFSPAISAVIHVHHRALWLSGRGRLSTTEPQVPYGTPQMAYEMWRLWSTSSLSSEQILVMAGHEEGVITFGASLAAAENILLKALRQYTDTILPERL
ncbi:MAG: class II aldolase/adducin family protein [Spirochaetota bacterium]